MFLPRPNYSECTGLGGKYETLDGAITDKITIEEIIKGESSASFRRIEYEV
jgi:hypothetical protein